MPWLESFIDSALDAPGFVLPLFRQNPGANVDLVQAVDHRDLVQGFREIVAPSGLLRPALKRIAVEIGDPALWAFKDHRGMIHVGATPEMAKVAAWLIEGDALSAWPLARLELSRFSEPNKPNAQLLRDAFQSVRDDAGDHAAEVWRDTEVFGPAVRRDIQRHTKMPEAVISREIFVLHQDQLNIFVDPRTIDRFRGAEWPETREILRALGFENNEIWLRPFGDESQSRSKESRFCAIGIGGVARHVLREAFFGGYFFAFYDVQGGPGIRADRSLGSIVRSYPTSHFVAVCQSGEGQVDAMIAQAENFPQHAYIRHLVNVRPFNFGSPPPRKTSVRRVMALADGVDYIWIVAGHRQRRTGQFRNQLSVSNAASRLVSSLLKSVVRRGDLLAEIANEGLAKAPSLNLFGMIRPRPDWTEQELFRNLLHRMLCEEAELHTSEKIVVLMPGEASLRTVRVRLGIHEYDVQLVPDPRRNRIGGGDLFAWAISAGLPSEPVGAFKEFCIGLLDGYGWDYRGMSKDGHLFEDEGEAIRVWPAYNLASVIDLISREAEFGDGDVILTPQTVSVELERRAERSGWTLLHYSEFPPWLLSRYRSGRYHDAEQG